MCLGFILCPSSCFLHWRRHSKAPHPPYLSRWEFGSLLTFLFHSCWPVIFLTLRFPNHSSSVWGPVWPGLQQTELVAVTSFLQSWPTVTSLGCIRAVLIFLITLLLHTGTCHRVTGRRVAGEAFAAYLGIHKSLFLWQCWVWLVQWFLGVCFNVNLFRWDIVLQVAIGPYIPIFFFFTVPVWHVCAAWLTSKITVLIT